MYFNKIQVYGWALTTAVVSFIVLLLAALYYRGADKPQETAPEHIAATSAQSGAVLTRVQVPGRSEAVSALAVVIEPWEPLQAASVPLAFQRAETANIAYLTMRDISLPRVGDNLNFTIPQENKSYIGKVASVSMSPSGNRSVAGTLEIEGSKTGMPSVYKFVLTSGESHVFATLNTPQGQYQMEAQEGIGRLIPTASIRSKLDYNKPDYVTPDSDVAPIATKQG